MAQSAGVQRSGGLDPESARRLVQQWAVRFLRHHDDALDVTQVVLLKSLTAVFPDAARHTAWLRTATYHACVDVIRRRRSEASPHPVSVGGAEPWQRLADAERRDRLMLALQDLTDHQRQVLLSKAIDGRTFAEIALALDVATSTVKTHYVRALQRLRGCLESEGGER